MNASWLILARMLQGVCAGAGPALGRAILRDLYSGEKLTRSLAAVAASVALSPMLGPVVGGYLQTAFGWRSNFVFLTVAAVALLLCINPWLPETHASAFQAADSVVCHSSELFHAALGSRIHFRFDTRRNVNGGQLRVDCRCSFHF